MAPPALSREQALLFLDDLLDEYIMPGFQQKLWDAWVDADEDESKLQKAVAELREPIEAEVLSKFGLQSVHKALAALPEALDADEPLARRCTQLAVLLSPDLQLSGEMPPPMRQWVAADGAMQALAAPQAAAAPKAAPAPPLPVAPGSSTSSPANSPKAAIAVPKAVAEPDITPAITSSAGARRRRFTDDAARIGSGVLGSKEAAQGPAKTGPPQLWKVVGGAAQGGIMVRSQESLSSELVKPRLSKGAVVEELNRSGDRLQYRLISGEGPETGWVSVAATGKVLMEPCT